MFTLAGGVWADRLPRRLVMLLCDAIRAGVRALVAVTLFTEATKVWMFGVAGAIFAAAGVVFTPASIGLVPEAVTDVRLQEARGLFGNSR